MPPYVSRKRESSPIDPPSPKRQKAAVRGKKTVFDDVDSHKATTASAKDARAYLDQIDGESDETSSDDDDDSDHLFEDVPGVRNATQPPSGEDEEDAEMGWEDAIDQDERAEPAEIEDVTISITEDGPIATATDRAASTLRKGPSARERQVRNGTHYIHVQSLIWHNAVRNSWLNDPEIHQILLDGLPEGVRIEIDRYRSYMGMTEVTPLSTSKKRRGPKNKGQKTNARGSRDWETDATRTEGGAINRSGGDPVLRLLKLMTAYWRKRFVVTAPGLRKLGYMPLKRLTQEINTWKKDRLDQEKHGERVEDTAALRRLAKSCRGSRDVGSQLFTALMRALGLEARMVANLQPAGIGWGKAEEAKSVTPGRTTAAQVQTKSPSKAKPKKDATTNGTKNIDKAEKKPSKGETKAKEVISLDTDDESSLSSALSDLESDASLVDVTDLYKAKKPEKKLDRDLTFPNYWTEVLSAVSNTWIPVDPVVLSTVATNPELVATFEPRGKAADQSKQVMCYTVAHSADGTAKDVTVRYLKKHQLPGRTKGYRIPLEKIKVYNKKGKVLRYEDYDWFKTVISLFARPHEHRTAADDLEESTDLKPVSSAAKPTADLESLQWYKQSAEFVLERHLRREEAIPPTAQPVKTFLAGKGEKAAPEPVYLRSVVVACKTAESWHKEGRQIMVGEQPMKLVPMRAVTTARKREMEEVERETGEKAKQGLFARAQTEWIIPPPIGPDREIPRNAFGNIDVYVPSMVPEGAVHLRLKGSARICRDLGISHAEAVTGFEFGKRMAIPIITGVVVAKENKTAVVDAWRAREVERKRKEDAKLAERCLGLWRKMCSGLRIMERMRKEYAGKGSEEDLNPFVRRAALAAKEDAGDVAMEDGDKGGGFLLPDEEEKEEGIDLGGGFVVEEDTPAEADSTTLPDEDVKPISLRAAHGSLQEYVFDAPTPTASEPSDSEAPPPTEEKKGKKGKAPATKRGGKKTQGTKSKYFPPASSSSSLSEVDEEEVVRPRRTTARTKRK